MRMIRFAVLILGSSLFAASAVGPDAAKPERQPTRGQTFFERNVVPKLAENGCPMCHAVGYVHPNVVIYEELLPYLAMGDAPEKTAVIRKIANLRAIRTDLPTHPGGQRCPTIGSEPCKSIIEWWQIEFGDESSANGGGK